MIAPQIYSQRYQHLYSGQITQNQNYPHINTLDQIQTASQLRTEREQIPPNGNEDHNNRNVDHNNRNEHNNGNQHNNRNEDHNNGNEDPNNATPKPTMTEVIIEFKEQYERILDSFNLAK